MNGRSGKRLMRIALAMALITHLMPVSALLGFAVAAEGKSAKSGKALVQMPDFKPQPVADSVSLPPPEPVQKISPVKAAAPAFVMQQLDESETLDRLAGAPQKTKALQGSVTSVHVTRGRSQIVKFAQPIMRLSIAEPSVADIIPLSPDQIMVNGKLRGVTSLIVWDENGQEGIFDLYVQNDSSELLDAVNAIAPNEKIQARVTDDSFILSGQVSSSVVLDEIRKTAAAYGYRDDKFIDLTDTPVPQVLLEVRIAEANRSIGRKLKTAYQLRSDTGNLNVIRLANPLDGTFLANVVNRTTSGLTPNAFGPIQRNQSGTNVGGTTGSFNPFSRLSVIWDLLETSGKLNTLANPTLVCTHGRSASFLAGGEFPYVAGTDQNGSPIIQFKEFGVKLGFTPWIAIKSGRIELKVSPEVSNVDSSNCQTTTGGFQVCGIAKRSTDTTVELMDGETLMISGILSREEQNTFSKVPFIGNLPILGNFFKNADMSKSDRELVVVITPHIVKAADYGKVLSTVQ